MPTEKHIHLRKVCADDLDALIAVERGATPGLSYVPNVFEMFLSDQAGDFSLAEVDGVVAGCGKFTPLPDGSAWLETLRVLPQYQGMGIGKRFYEHFLELARQKGITTLRMYTGLRNVVSKGLAERFGFHLAASFHGAYRICPSGAATYSVAAFKPVASPERAAALLMPHSEGWGGYLVMNRTFYVLSPALCGSLARQGMVYEHPLSGSVAVLGARFMPKQALHIGLFVAGPSGGDAALCLAFAEDLARARGAGRLSCLFSVQSVGVQETLLAAGFELEKADFIVMENTQEK
jgi:GNAT superfamily N-acetyltransferase